MKHRFLVAKSMSRPGKTKGCLSSSLGSEGCVCFVYMGRVRSREDGESFLSILICQVKHTSVPLRRHKPIEAPGFPEKYFVPVLPLLKLRKLPLFP